MLLCWSVLQFVTMCCSVLQIDRAVSVLQCFRSIVELFSIVHYFFCICWNKVHLARRCKTDLRSCVAVSCSVLQCVSVLQSATECAAVRCSTLQYVAVCSGVLSPSFLLVLCHVSSPWQSARSLSRRQCLPLLSLPLPPPQSRFCRVKMTFELLPKIWFVSTRTNSMKCFVKWIPVNTHVRSNKTQSCLNQIGANPKNLQFNSLNVVTQQVLHERPYALSKKP